MPLFAAECCSTVTTKSGPTINHLNPILTLWRNQSFVFHIPCYRHCRRLLPQSPPIIRIFTNCFPYTLDTRPISINHLLIPIGNLIDTVQTWMRFYRAMKLIWRIVATTTTTYLHKHQKNQSKQTTIHS